MKKIIIILVVIAAASVGIFAYIQINSNIPVDARTLYHGSVAIKPVDIEVIKEKLKSQACKPVAPYVTCDTNNPIEVMQKSGIGGKETPGILVGIPGFGPTGFTITTDRVWADKDIPGSPNKEAYKNEVRQDISSINNIVQIDESSWNIDTKYPWAAVY